MNLDYWQAPGHVSARGMQSRPAVVHAVVETTGVETTGVRQKKIKTAEESSTWKIIQQLAWRLAVDNTNSSSDFWSELREVFEY